MQQRATSRLCIRIHLSLVAVPSVFDSSRIAVVNSLKHLRPNKAACPWCTRQLHFGLTSFQNLLRRPHALKRKTQCPPCAWLYVMLIIDSWVIMLGVDLNVRSPSGMLVFNMTGGRYRRYSKTGYSTFLQGVWSISAGVCCKPWSFSQEPWIWANHNCIPYLRRCTLVLLCVRSSLWIFLKQAAWCIQLAESNIRVRMWVHMYN